MFKSEDEIDLFRKTILDRFFANKRNLPWRECHDPYSVFVSEVMLQQTQVERILTIFPKFLARFPDIEALAKSEPADVLQEWVGLGYYRRAVSLRLSARIILSDYKGIMPKEKDLLEKLPGIGPATAGAIAAFAFNQPVVFLETNIRRVFIHFFFNQKAAVHDNEIIPLLEQSLDATQPRNWYYALTDYGVMLKKCIPNPNRRSVHYQKQSQYEGSDRQIRAAIIKTLLQKQVMAFSEIQETLSVDPERLKRIIIGLKRDRFVTCEFDSIKLM